MTEKELKKRIEETKADASQRYVDSKIIEIYEQRLKRLIQLYEDLYGY